MAWVRSLVQETDLSPRNLVWPVFVTDGPSGEIPGMPGVRRQTISELCAAARIAHRLGIAALAVFPVVPDNLRSSNAAESLNRQNLVCRAIDQLKKTIPSLGVIADVALDPYTDTGHDGFVENGIVANDRTVSHLAQMAVVLAEAGADFVAPSDMMDGRVKSIRCALDQSSLSSVGILSYAAKFSSCFYGPFRNAIGSANALGAANKDTYQLSAANALEALREGMDDVAEGADIIMVKPGLPYLDIVTKLKQCVDVPVAAYQVSGEYAMLHCAADAGLIDIRLATLETLMAFRRAGADFVLTYSAVQAALWMAHSGPGSVNA